MLEMKFMLLYKNVYACFTYNSNVSEKLNV